MQLPPSFIQKLNKQHSSLADDVVQGLASADKLTSIRYNPDKGSPPAQDIVPWCPHAMYLQDRPDFTLDPNFHGGRYYVQEASSMILYYLMKTLSESRDIKVLDLCAAPGGKSTTILDFLKGHGLLIANEVIKSRIAPLEQNIIKWGYNNAVVTCNDPEAFADLPSYFDVVVVDAPCSGEGMFRKDHDAVSEWSEEHVIHCSARQRRIIDDAVIALKPGGYLIYSTCTFNHEENIDNVAYFCERHGLATMEISLPPEWHIHHINKHGRSGYQFFPGITRGEGFFFAVLQKKFGEEYTPSYKIKPVLEQIDKKHKALLHHWSSINHLLIHNNGTIYGYNDMLATDINTLLTLLNVKYSGVRCGTFAHDKFIPDPALALSHYVSQAVTKIQLDKNEALHYLHKSLAAVHHNHTSWLLAQYENINLGWLKNLGNRINNYYPTEWRIRKDVPAS